MIKNPLFSEYKPFFFCTKCQASVPANNYFIVVKKNAKTTEYLHRGNCPSCHNTLSGPVSRTIKTIPGQGKTILIKDLKKQPKVISYEEYKKDFANNRFERH